MSVLFFSPFFFPLPSYHLNYFRNDRFFFSFGFLSFRLFVEDYAVDCGENFQRLRWSIFDIKLLNLSHIQVNSVQYYNNAFKTNNEEMRTFYEFSHKIQQHHLLHEVCHLIDFATNILINS